MLNESKAEDLVSVLRNLGYKKAEAQRRVEAVIEQHQEAETSLEVLIKAALAWVHPPDGIMKAQQAVVQAQPLVEDSPAPEASAMGPPSNPTATARFVWEAKEIPELEEPKKVKSGGATGWMVTGAAIGALVGTVMWLGVVKFLLGLAGLLVIFYFIGKTVGKAES
jgi:hypothetical protein